MGAPWLDVVSEQGESGRWRPASLPWRACLDLGLTPSDVPEGEFPQLRVITTATWLFLLIAIASMVQAWMIGELRVFGYLIAGSVMGIGNLGLLRVTRRPMWAGHIAIATLMALVAASAMTSGGFHRPSFGWMYIIPLAAAVVVDTRSAVAWTLATMGVSTAFWLSAKAGIDFSTPIAASLQSRNALIDRLLTLTALGTLGISFAITHHRAQASLEREKRYLEMIRQAAVTANRARSFSEALGLGVEEICHAMGWEVGHVLMVQSDGTCTATAHRVWNLPGDLAHQVLGRPREPFDRPLPRRAIETREPQILAGIDGKVPIHLAGPASRVEIARSVGLSSAIFVPILVRDRVGAVLEFASRHPFPERDTEHLLDVFRHIGVELGRVAERTELQEQVRQKQKMAAVGQLAAGIAHEVNNPMSFVRSNLHALRGALLEVPKPEEEGAREDLAELVDDSLEGVERTIAIVRDMVRFSRTGSTDPREWEEALLDELIADSIRVAASDAPPGVRLEVAPSLPTRIVCAPNALRQVFLNLVLNAVHAVGPEGTVRAAVEDDGNVVVVCVEDDGPGVARADQERLFEPFYTTKPVGQGAGLGLSVSFEIVASHRGEIRVSDSRMGGARFEVRLPHNEKTANAVDPDPTNEPVTP